ncbi:MAG TPA: hypothetical protein VFI88_02620 [Sphingomicrobium sp.]|nr:hypothetical protein [Sphingomicrobium sp.]
MSYPITREEVRGLRANRERIAGLLRDYPAISDNDVREILTFLRTGRHLDIGMLTSNESLRPKLDVFTEITRRISD